MGIVQKIEPGAPTAIPEQDLRLVKDRVRVYPMTVKGIVRSFKWEVLIFCLLTYYLLPWLRWDRGPGRPDQALLLDIWNERMYVFGFEFWPQDIYLLAGALILAAFALFMVTSLLGRVWCGYTCPQTVWTDLFLGVERVIEGDRNERIRRDAGAAFLGQDLAQSDETFNLAPRRLLDRRRVDHVLCRCADRHARILERYGLLAGLFLYWLVHGDDLSSGRLGARAGLHLYVSLATLSGGHARRADADRHLSRLARRAARQEASG